MSKTMAQLPYHYGVKLRVFPSAEQKRLIKRNSDASRFIYNEMNGMNRELYLLKQVQYLFLWFRHVLRLWKSA